jgi:ankyrin repeat protein
VDIFDAIVKSDINQIRKLLKRGNVQNQVECDNITPLHFAVSYRVPEAVSLLLEFGVDVDKANADGLTALDYAIEFNDNRIIDIFKKWGCDNA